MMDKEAATTPRDCKPCHTDPLCDDEVTGGQEVPGFILCERAACLATHQDLPVEARRELFNRTCSARRR